MGLALGAVTAISWLISVGAIGIYALGAKGVRDSVRALRRPEELSGLRADPGRQLAAVVPARNELNNISRLVQEILADRRLRSLVVVDDGSTDGTGAEAFRAAGGDPRLRVVRVEDRPSGWAPKAFAVHEGASLVEGGDALLFLDADVNGNVSGLAELVLRLAKDGVLIAFEPRFTCESPFCRMTQPMLSAILHGFYGFHRALDLRSTHSLMYGCCWALTPYTFWEAGGMARVKDTLLEDRTLAVALKSMGVRLVPVDGRALVSVHSWDSPRELANLLRRISVGVVRGLGLPAYVGLSIGLALLFLWPWALIPMAIMRLWLAAAGPLAAYAAQASFTITGAREAGLPWAWGLLAPVAGLFVVYGIVSSRWAPVEWKGRVYRPS